MKHRKINRSKRHTNGCRNNGPCAYCRSSRQHQANREIQRIDDQLRELVKGGIPND